MNNEVEIMKYENEDEYLNPNEENICLLNVTINIPRNSILVIPICIRQNIELLGECVCEALKRQQNFSRLLIKQRTLEFRKIMQQRNLSITKRWFNRVRYEYKLVLANKAEAKKLTIQNEIDLQEILTFCINKLKKKKLLTLEKKVKIIRTFDKVPSCSKISHLYGVPYDKIGHIMTNRDKIMNYFNEISKSIEIQSIDIILPKLSYKMRKERDLIPDDILKNIKLLGECVCEALKRQQNFSQPWIDRRTEEFFKIMQLKQFGIPDCWFEYVGFDFKLRFATEEEAQKETLPVEVDLHEILTFCIKKLVKQNKNQTEIGKNNDSLNNSRCEFKSFELRSPINPKDLNISTYSDVLKILNPIKDFAALCANHEGLEYISKLEDHIKNKINI